MGPLDYFTKRRERESAVPPGDDESRFGFPGEESARSEESSTEGAGAVAETEVDSGLTPGQQHDVGQLFQMVGQALRTGQFQIEETKTMNSSGDDTDGDGQPS